ncbi:5'/3'-nucleotidase SurE [Trujillonella humicola]|uniref:5'/3'-nucleotidase SurE n=1 Tax=Trujillonella humicola TaxID=3383699 RepID=UPI003905EF63
MRILLTNDDGVQQGVTTQGVYELRRALCAAGADVVVVAPWTEQSGRSAAITYGSSSTRFTLGTPDLAGYAGDCADAPSGGAVYGACVTAVGGTCTVGSTSLTPADAVTLGATAAVQQVHQWTNGPDLVISGINSGGNDGQNVNVSGTVGAATIAVSLGYPAIALSTSTSGVAASNYVATATWAVPFVARLAAERALPADYVLNVNHPRVDRGRVTQAVWTTVAQNAAFATTYQAEGLSFRSVYGQCTGGTYCGAPERGSDSAAYAAGQIAVTPVSVDRTVADSASLQKARALVQSGAFSTR